MHYQSYKEKENKRRDGQTISLIKQRKILPQTNHDRPDWSKQVRWSAVQRSYDQAELQDQ